MQATSREPERHKKDAEVFLHVSPEPEAIDLYQSRTHELLMRLLEGQREFGGTRNIRQALIDLVACRDGILALHAKALSQPEMEQELRKEAKHLWDLAVHAYHQGNEDLLS